VCHHDFSQSDLAGWAFPSNVRFVRPHVRTSWGTFSLVEATLALLREMYGRGEGPRWATLLSAADYPVVSAQRMMSDLDAGGFDAHVQHKRVDERALDPEWYAKDWHRRRDPGEHFVDRGKAYEWYCTVPIPLSGRRLWRPALTRRLLPFSQRMPCHAGSQWFTIGEAAARRLLDAADRERRLAAHYRRVMVPDESYFQTLLASMPDLKLHDRNWRYTEWQIGQGHPKTLGPEDLPGIVSSGVHFARKLAADAPQDFVAELDALCR